MDSLSQIINYTIGSAHGAWSWILQKYIENPLIIENRKFDIRLWILVTSNDPLTIWCWTRPYIWFPAADYNSKNLKDNFIHLTNNSVAKHAPKTNKILGDGNMWFSEELQKYLDEKFHWDVWTEDIMPQMHTLVINSLKCVADKLGTHKGSFEIFGYDIMIDEDLNPWLLEVNSSPTMEYSTVSHLTYRESQKN